MKKSMILFAVAVIAVFCMTGCGDDRNEYADSVTDGQPSASSEQQTVPGSSADTNLQNQQSSLQDIGQDRVMAIALEKIPGAAASDVTEIEREYEHGRIEYEGEIWYNGYEYEFEIDGATGNILKWEIDR